MTKNKPTIFSLLKTALYIGTIGYGGAANLALMKKTFVQEKEWISEKDFMDALSLSQILPGSTGVALMGYIGFRHYKILGGILIPLAFILPATIAIIILSWAYFRFGDISFVKALFAGLGALVVALLVNATLMLGKSVFKKITIKSWRSLVVSLVTFIGVFFFKINVIYLILIAGTLGFLFYYFTNEFDDEKVKKGEVLLKEPTVSFWKSISTKDWTALAVLTAILAVGLLVPPIRDLIISFVSIGIFAFGGGFTIIPLIQHQVVGIHSWLTVKQFIDGIALGQVTPGPVLITSTFVGYRVAGIIGALYATLAIFLVPMVAMIALADIHAKIRDLKIVKVIVKGFLAGFIGLLLAVTLQFAIKSLISWQAWLIFTVVILWIMVLKKNSIWAILGTLALSFLLF
jgi:chromate transporter